MRYLPNAFAFIYVIDVSHAGGVQEDLKKKVKILKYNVALRINTQYCTVLSSIVDHIYCMQGSGCRGHKFTICLI